MKRLISLGLGLSILAFMALPAAAGLLFNNDTPNGAMATASRPDTAGKIEIEAADDFVLTSQTLISGASFTGLLTGNATIGQVVVEIYRIFPKDSDTGRTINVNSRTNSPSDVAFDSRDSAASNLTFTTSILSATFTANNSVLNGINPKPGQTTGGDGTVTGQEVRFDVNFTTPLDLPADHYFFVPQVEVMDPNGEFFWLSASRPISGAGTTPFPMGFTDLQTWIRNGDLDPDWSRVGTDIVGGATPPTFNAAFSLNGTEVPLPGTLPLLGTGLAGLAVWRRLRRTT
jgi:hypothetical protein